MPVATRIDRYDLSRQETVVDDAWLVRRILAGWKPAAVVAASGGRVSLRTVYRLRETIVGLETVRVGAWEADFAIRRQGPLRIGPWRCAK